MWNVKQVLTIGISGENKERRIHSVRRHHQEGDISVKAWRVKQEMRASGARTF